MLTISGSAIIGYGSSLIYKEGLSASSIDILQDIFNSTRIYKDKSFSYAFEVIIVLLTSFIISIESAVYSAIAIIILIYMSTKSKIGISTRKTFYIITEKPDEIKEYLINELECDYTEINVADRQEDREEVLKVSGQRTVPVIDIDGKIIVGFNRALIDEAIK